MQETILTEDEKIQIKEIVSQKLDLDFNKLQDNSTIINSLTEKWERTELQLEIELVFDITIFEKEIETVKTLNDLFNIITEILNE